MAKIILEDIKKQVEENGWKVISKEYKNLDTEMIFECSEGHKVYAPWKKIRNKCECPVCKENIYKDMITKSVAKKKGVRRVLALDQATHISGFSIFDDKQLVYYGKFETDESDEISRDAAIRTWLLNMIANWKPDQIGIEGIQMQQIDGKQVYGNDNVVGITTFQVLARLQGILMITAYEKKIPYEICPTPTWRSYCGVKGRSRPDKKRSAQLIIKNLYDISVDNDIADAILIGKYVAEKVAKPLVVTSWE